MARFPRYRFLALAVVFHLTYIASIFDIYFVSPIVSGMRLFKVERPSNSKPPADRLVLFVGDGLRADKAFQLHPEPYPQSDADLEPRPLAPFLRSRVLEQGTFGVSHTRVPTESRPGHVALIAGLYEDVSAVTTGWKLNPVNFDSVFNRSQHTWSWGSPDILPMFEKGAVPGRVDAFMYGAEEEDFSQDATHLDYWVFDHVKELFAEAHHNGSLKDALKQDRVVFFLHLLGLDTTGHSYRPYSKEYLHNLKIVDQGVKEVTEMIERFYNDGRTAYVFTADHGMSDWGSHGDGHPNNTRTPLIVWGSGIAKPEVHPGAIAPGHDEYSSDWFLSHIRRHDVSQADVAALMAHLVGVEFPANSVGELPLTYLSADVSEKAEALLVNAQGILEMYRVKEEKKRASELRFRPYRPLGIAGYTSEERITSIRKLIDAGKYEEAIEESESVMKIGLQGLRYLQTYDWLFLRAIITIGYLGWMLYAITTVVNLYVLQGGVMPSRNLTAIAAFTAVYVVLAASFVMSRSPFAYFAYAFFPVFFWEEVYACRECLTRGASVIFGKTRPISLVLGASAYIAIILLLAIGYIHRKVLTALYIVGALWPLSSGLLFVQEHKTLSTVWGISCLSMSVFTLMSAMKTENVTIIMVGGTMMVTIGVLYLAFDGQILSRFSMSKSKTKPGTSSISRTVIGVQIGLIALAMVVTRSSALSLQAKQGLPRGNQVVGWLVLGQPSYSSGIFVALSANTIAVISLLMPMAHRLDKNDNYLHRMVVIFLTCAPTFVILAISYEGLFYVVFWVLLVAWVRLEYEVYAKSIHKMNVITSTSNGVTQTQQEPTSLPNLYRPLTLADSRTALFFFVFLQSAFFSTGNVASISSFSLESVSRLLPIFDPFSQGALLVLKLMIPFALVSANLGILNRLVGVAPSALFMMALAISDILTLYFFWVVKDEGSWLEIGSTISHFAIASLLSVFVAALEGVSAWFVSGLEVLGAPAAGGKALVANGDAAKTNGNDTKKLS